MNITWSNELMASGLRFSAGGHQRTFDAEQLVDNVLKFGVDHTTVWLGQQIEDHVGVDFSSGVEAAANGMLMLAERYPQIRGSFP